MFHTGACIFHCYYILFVSLFEYNITVWNPLSLKSNRLVSQNSWRVDIRHNAIDSSVALCSLSSASFERQPGVSDAKRLPIWRAKHKLYTNQRKHFACIRPMTSEYWLICLFVAPAAGSGRLVVRQELARRCHSAPRHSNNMLVHRTRHYTRLARWAFRMWSQLQRRRSRISACNNIFVSLRRIMARWWLGHFMPLALDFIRCRCML